MIAELDSNLHEGQELKEIYEEIMKTLPTKHLEFTSVSTHTLLLILIQAVII